MRNNLSRVVRMAALVLTCSAMLVIQVEAGQGKGKGRVKAGEVPARVDPTASTPASPNGRGRNTTPGTRRGRYVRTAGNSNSNTNQRNPEPGTPRRRRVRRGQTRN
jgi:hypothetical protein